MRRVLWVFWVSAMAAFELSGCKLDDWGTAPPQFGRADLGGPPPAFVDLGSPMPRAAVNFGATVTRAVAPPPISGGTLVVLTDRKTVVAADPDRDRVYVVDVPGRAVRATVTLLDGDEPGRGVEDGATRVHVALRRGGAIADIDAKTGALLGRRPVCPAPRGIAWRASDDSLIVACAGGELVTLPAAGGTATRTVQLDLDLRDVVVDGANLLVSRFRSAELLTIDATGRITARRAPGEALLKSMTGLVHFQPAVAWRTLAKPGGGAFMLHQRALSEVVEIGKQEGGYGGAGDPCGGIVQSTSSQFLSDGSSPVANTRLGAMVLPVDAAFSPDGKSLAMVAAGNSRLPIAQVFKLSVGEALQAGGPGCLAPAAFAVDGQAIAVGWLASGDLVVQTREPATLQIAPPIIANGLGGAALISLADDSREDTGHAIFHSSSGAGIACASCHPEGGEDGRTWSFSQIGARRTQSLRGGVLALAPFHWDGSLPTLPALVKEVFVHRMGASPLQDDQIDALAHWLDRVPLLASAAPVDAASVTRGRALFEDQTGAACSTCHAGARLTNLAKVDVGTGGEFLVPSLIGARFRAPFLHNGCAPTLVDRFGACGGGDKHGNVKSLGPAQIADLTAYLESL